MYTYINIKTGKKIVTPCKVNGDWELVADTNEKAKPKEKVVTSEGETKEDKKTTKKKK